MKIFVLLILILFATIVEGQSPCDKVRLYDQMIVKGDKPMLHKLKPFDIKLIPDTTILKMNKEIIKATSPKFFSELKINSVKLCDSARAIAWSWTNDQIVDNNSNPVYFFYAVLFETKTINESPFIFRLDVLKNGELLDKEQIAFFKKKRLNLISCKKVVALILADTIQQITSIEGITLAYSPKEHAVIWRIIGVVNPNTEIRYYKEVNAITGEIIGRYAADMKTPPQPVRIEEAQVQPKN